MGPDCPAVAVANDHLAQNQVAEAAKAVLPLVQVLELESELVLAAEPLPHGGKFLGMVSRQ